MTQNDPFENDKNSKILNLYRFYTIFLTIFERLRELECWNVQQGTNSLSNSLFMKR